jgi:DNA ligase 1
MLPQLFKLRSDKRIQTWAVEVVDDRYRFHSGIEGGQITTSAWTQAVAMNVGKKNGTTAVQQATLEARAHWQKKLDGGYYEKKADVHTPKFFKPMLAQVYESQSVAGTFSQPKLDGVRCIAKADGLWSRTGEQFVAVPHIAAALRPLLDADPDLIFDGELYADKFADNFNAIVSAVRKTKPTSQDLELSAASIQYHVYDLPSSTLFGQRYEKLRQLLATLPANGPIVLVKTVTITSQSQLDDLYGRYIAEGYEGQMIRTNAPYENKRSKSLLKRKTFVDEEFTVLDVVEGVGNRAGVAGVMRFATVAGKSFAAAVMGTQADRAEYLKNKEKYIGTSVTVRYFALTPDGVPRFPVVSKVVK